MKRLHKLLISILMVGLVAWAVSDTLYAQRGRPGPGRPGPGGGAFQYVVKFVCGSWFNAIDEEMAPGIYWTDVNIHNPNDEIITLRKKIALDGDKPQHSGIMTSPVDVILGPDEALEVNCSDIEELLENAGAGPFLKSADGVPQFFLKGFVVIYSRVKLDVAGIYTACPIDFGATPKGGCNPTIAGDGISTIFVDQPIPPSPVAAPQVFIDGLSVSSASVELHVRPFSRFAYEGARLQVFDINGNLLHDSGFTTGTRLTWRPLAADGRPLANGVYLYAVTVQDTLGQYSTKIGKFALVR